MTFSPASAQIGPHHSQANLQQLHLQHHQRCTQVFCQLLVQHCQHKQLLRHCSPHCLKDSALRQLLCLHQHPPLLQQPPHPAQQQYQRPSPPLLPLLMVAILGHTFAGLRALKLLASVLQKAQSVLTACTSWLTCRCSDMDMQLHRQVQSTVMMGR